MAFSTIFTNGHVPNQIKMFSVDTVEDMNAIDISQLLPGSRTFVIDDSQWYMLSVADRKWTKVNLGTSGGNGGSSGGSEDEDHTYYDGGSEDGGLPIDTIDYDGGSEDG